MQLKSPAISRSASCFLATTFHLTDHASEVATASESGTSASTSDNIAMARPSARNDGGQIIIAAGATVRGGFILSGSLVNYGTLGPREIDISGNYSQRPSGRLVVKIDSLNEIAPSKWEAKPTWQENCG